MKRNILVAFCILALCSLPLLANTVTVNAAPASGYTRTDWYLQITKTIDGTWTNDTEWTDGEPTLISGNVTFRSVWDMGVYTQFVIEFFTDTTNDTGDYWQMCIDKADAGGTALSDANFRIDIVGHTNLTVYQGGASGWTEFPSAKSDVEWANSISASPMNSTPHWILEIRVLKNAGAQMMNEVWGLRVACFDASNAAAGVQAWPPNSSRDVPDQWGTQTYQMAAYPEALTITAVILLSSAAVIVGFYWLRKRPKTESYSAGKISYTR